MKIKFVFFLTVVIFATHIQAAQEIMRELNGQTQTVSTEADRAKLADLLRDAYSGLREGQMAKQFGSPSECPKKLRALPTENNSATGTTEKAKTPGKK